VKDASKVVKAAYEAGKSIVQTVKIVRRTTRESIFIEGTVNERVENVILPDATEESVIVRRTLPLPDNLQMLLPAQAAQLAACNQAFREGVILLWRQNLDDDLFWQAVEDLYSRYTAERAQLGISAQTIIPNPVRSGVRERRVTVIEGSFREEGSL
jgi:hypothetical protein